jgi:hypothetical protein
MFVPVVGPCLTRAAIHRRLDLVLGAAVPHLHI